MTRNPRQAEPPIEWLAPDYKPGDATDFIYARLSFASDEDQTGVDRQIADSTAFARKTGAKRLLVYRDNGISAYKPSSFRPAFELMMEEISRCSRGRLIAWRAERIARRQWDAERLLRLTGVDEGHLRVPVVTLMDGVDTSTNHGIDHFRDLVRFGHWESEAIVQRVRRAHQKAIESGSFTGSPPAFGHRDGTKWRQVEPAEAALIQDAATRVIAGQGVRSITRLWSEQGSLTREGKGWQHSAFIKMITSARMAGLRLVRGVETSGVDAAGAPNIAPILDVDIWREVRRILLDPARRPKHPGGEPRHLLTNLMRCGKKCRGPLRAKGMAGKRTSPGYWTYSCLKDAYHVNACGGIHIHGAHTDTYIEGLVLAALDDPAVKLALMRGTAADLPESEGGEGREAKLRMELSDLTERIIAVEAAWMAGPAELEEQFQISPAGYKRWRETANARRDELDRLISQSARSRSIMAAVANPVDYWARAELIDRRDLVRLLFPEIVVLPAIWTKGFPQRWDRNRIRITPLGV